MENQVEQEIQVERDPYETETESEFEGVVDSEEEDIGNLIGRMIGLMPIGSPQRVRTRQSASKRADITFSCAITSKKLKKRDSKIRYGKSKKFWQPDFLGYVHCFYLNLFKLFFLAAVVYLTSVLEYVTAELLEGSGDRTRNQKKVRITPRDIAIAIKKDAELFDLLKDVTIPSAGVQPHIHKVLLPNKKKWVEDSKLLN